MTDLKTSFYIVGASLQVFSDRRDSQALSVSRTAHASDQSSPSFESESTYARDSEPPRECYLGHIKKEV